MFGNRRGSVTRRFVLRSSSEIEGERQKNENWRTESNRCEKFRCDVSKSAVMLENSLETNKFYSENSICF